MSDIKLGKSFKFLSAGIEKVANRMLKEVDLSMAQSIALIWLGEAEGHELPIKVIERRFGKAQSTTLGIINRLEQKGLVSTCLREHKTKHVTITPQGLALVDIICTSMRTADELLFEGFTPGERMLFIELLRKAEGNLLQQHGIEMGDYYE